MSPAATNATITLTSEVENVMATLTDILNRESDAVSTCDFNSFRQIQNDKYAMLLRYRSLMDTLQRQTGAISKMAPQVIERLQASNDKFRVSADRNRIVLEAGKNSMQRIVDRIVRCAREHMHGDRQSYNKSGQSGMKIQSPLSLQINEVL